MLTLHPDNCRFPHGHSRRVEVILEAEDLDERGMVCDFKVVTAAAAELLDRYDHALCINTNDPLFETLQRAYGERIIAFEAADPTTERIAKALHEEISARLEEYTRRANARYPLRGGIRLARVRVWETSSSWAEYAPY